MVLFEFAMAPLGQGDVSAHVARILDVIDRSGFALPAHADGHHPSRANGPR